MQSRDEIIDRIGIQVAKPVLWESCVRTALKLGCNTFVEVGPKPILSSLVKSTEKAIHVK